MSRVALALVLCLACPAAARADDGAQLCTTYASRLESAAAGQVFFFTGYDWSGLNVAKSLSGSVWEPKALYGEGTGRDLLTSEGPRRLFAELSERQRQEVLDAIDAVVAANGETLDKALNPKIHHGMTMEHRLAVFNIASNTFGDFCGVLSKVQSACAAALSRSVD